MKKLILFVFIFFVAVSAGVAQDLKVKIYDPPITYDGNVEWGPDYVVANSEPLGRPSGVYRNSNSTIYVAIPDTNISLPGANEGLVILTSTNNGVNWVQEFGISPAVVIQKTKVIRSGLDSVYCFFQVDGSIYKFNLLNGSFAQFFNGGYRDFDVAASSTGALYIFIDSSGTNSIPRYASTDGGQTWPIRASVTANGAHPRIYMSGTGDTLVLNYYGPVLSDTATSVIRNTRYRETTPGTLLVTGAFSDIVTSAEPKPQFGSVMYGQTIWFFYTTGTSGNMDLNCRVSSNGGVNFGTSFTMGSLPGRDEFWFDAKHYSSGSGGVGIIYYSDSAQTGPPTNISDKMYYTAATLAVPDNFATSTQFSEHPPVFSTRGYIPTLIQYYNTAGDAGAIWVGADGLNRKIYFDRLQSTTGITQQTEIPIRYSLDQNYPNPFNPTTNIHFSIPENSYVFLKVYDVLGKEVAALVNENLTAGSYNFDFNAANLTSGVYFYKLTTENFSDIKKMTLLK